MALFGPRRTLGQFASRRCPLRRWPLPLLVSLALGASLWARFRAFSNPEAAPALLQIPKILHQVGKSEMVFQSYRRTIESCLRLNPDWTYILWRDADAEALIAEFFPVFFRETYLKYSDPLQKSDSIRYIVLYLFGGVYLDMDVECRRPLFPALASETCFLDQESRLQANIFWDLDHTAMNSAMGCRPGHPFMLHLIRRVQMAGPDTNVLQTTGPQMLTRALNDWVSDPATAENGVKLLEPEVFSPFMDNKEILTKLCHQFSTKQLIASTPNRGTWISRGCRQALLGGLNDSFSERTVAVHRFMHLGWYKKHERAALKQFNISEMDRARFYSGPESAELRLLIARSAALSIDHAHVR